MRTAAGAVLLLAALSGCSAGDAAPAEVAPLASGTPSAAAVAPKVQPAEVPTPATVSPSSQSSATARPTTHTDESEASAFVEQYFDVVNDAYDRRDATEVSRRSSPACGSCAAVAKDIERLAEADHTVAGRRYILSFAEAAPARADGRIVVDFRFDSDPYLELDETGALVQQFPAEQSRDGQVLVDPSAGQFRIAAIRLVDQ